MSATRREFLEFTARAIALAGTQGSMRAPTERGKGEFNVLDYGAKLDGVADDTRAVQAAVDAAPAGSVVYVPPGTALLTAPLVIYKPLTFLGAGDGMTFFTANEYHGDLFQLNTGRPLKVFTDA